MTARIRRLFQILSFLAIDSYYKGVLTGQAIYQGVTKRFVVPALNCYSCPLSRFACPMGSFQHFLAVRQIPFYILGFFGLVGASVGRATCGWVCPFGLFQELLYKIPSYKFRIPRIFTYLKYVVLVVLAIILPIVLLEPWFCKFCPAGTIEAGIPLLSWDPVQSLGSSLLEILTTHFYVKYGILIFFVVLSLSTRRPFCRVACPVGAIFSIFNKLSVLRMYVDKSKCTKCDICYNVCPMEIRIYENASDLDCIRCGKCQSACPQGAIRFSTPLDMLRPEIGKDTVNIYGLRS